MQMIRKRDKESLICTNRREIIDLNVCIYRKLKEALHQFSELQSLVEIESKNKSKSKYKHKVIQNSHYTIQKSQNKEVTKHEEVLTVLFAQLKRLEEIASENHVTERILLSIIIQNKVILMMMLIHIHFLH